MNTPISPIYLLADSAPLFWKGEKGSSFLTSIRAEIEAEEPSAAYIGASNEDEPAFYSIFEAAMDTAGINERRMIKSRYSGMDHICLSAADLILLAGGDVALGWRVLDTTDMRKTIIERYYAGAVLIGVSAGAVQLGLKGYRAEDADEELSADGLFDTFRLLPFVLDVHDEDNQWRRLTWMVKTAGSNARGIGIPKGGAMIYHPDHTIEPVGRPLFEVVVKDGVVTESLLLPGEGEGGGEGARGGEGDASRER